MSGYTKFYTGFLLVFGWSNHTMDEYGLYISVNSHTDYEKLHFAVSLHSLVLMRELHVKYYLCDIFLLKLIYWASLFYIYQFSKQALYFRIFSSLKTWQLIFTTEFNYIYSDMLSCLVPCSCWVPKKSYRGPLAQTSY